MLLPRQFTCQGDLELEEAVRHILQPLRFDCHQKARNAVVTEFTLTAVPLNRQMMTPGRMH